MRVIPIALLFGLSLAAVPAAAQTAAAPATASDTLWGPKPTGVYDLVATVNGNPHDAVLGLTTDSTGATKANVDSEGQSHPMTVAFNGAEMVLTTDTPEGTMTLRLKRQGDKLTGSWQRVMEGGKLEGTRRP